MQSVDPIPRLSVKIADKDGDGNQELAIKFHRGTIATALDLLFDPGDDAVLTLNWAYFDLYGSSYDQVVRIVNE